MTAFSYISLHTAYIFFLIAKELLLKMPNFLPHIPYVREKHYLCANKILFQLTSKQVDH